MKVATEFTWDETRILYHPLEGNFLRRSIPFQFPLQDSIDIRIAVANINTFRPHPVANYHIVWAKYHRIALLGQYQVILPLPIQLLLIRRGSFLSLHILPDCNHREELAVIVVTIESCQGALIQLGHATINHTLVEFQYLPSVGRTTLQHQFTPRLHLDLALTFLQIDVVNTPETCVHLFCVVVSHVANISKISYQEKLIVA